MYLLKNVYNADMKNNDAVDLISIDDLLKQLNKLEIQLGQGDPYNRLRYYTKIGWIPNMQRKTINKKVIGHYPNHTLDLIKKIDELKSQNFSNDQISKELKKKNWTINLKNLLMYYKSFPATVGLLLLVVVLILQVYTYKQNEYIIQTNSRPGVNSVPAILESGSFYVPKNRSEVQIKTKNNSINTKVYVSFTQNYKPATKYWVEKDEIGAGFVLKLDTPPVQDANFDWWLSQ